jgi:hypothetical protein
MGEKQGLDWRTLPAHPVAAWEAIAEVAFPGYEIDREAVDAARRICDEPVSSARFAAEKIAAETEEWCAKAAARGEGYRLFRSDARHEHDADGYRIVHDFQILAPGEHAPASGVVFGPWPGWRIEGRDAP